MTFMPAFLVDMAVWGLTLSCGRNKPGPWATMKGTGTWTITDCNKFSQQKHHKPCNFGLRICLSDVGHNTEGSFQYVASNPSPTIGKLHCEYGFLAKHEFIPASTSSSWQICGCSWHWRRCNGVRFNYLPWRWKLLSLFWVICADVRYLKSLYLVDVTVTKWLRRSTIWLSFSCVDTRAYQIAGDQLWCQFETSATDVPEYNMPMLLKTLFAVTWSVA